MANSLASESTKVVLDFIAYLAAFGESFKIFVLRPDTSRRIKNAGYTVAIVVAIGASVATVFAASRWPTIPLWLISVSLGAFGLLFSFEVGTKWENRKGVRARLQTEVELKNLGLTIRGLRARLEVYERDEKYVTALLEIVEITRKEREEL